MKIEEPRVKVTYTGDYLKYREAQAAKPQVWKIKPGQVAKNV